jgi:hypothetical protein
MTSSRFLVALAVCLASLATPTLAASLDGQFEGASSIAGGTGECWGNNPASAIVSGDTITIRYAAYDGTSAPFTAPLSPDGSFRAIVPIKSGTIAYAGKVTARRVVANWKGPTCYGTLDMTR